MKFGQMMLNWHFYTVYHNGTKSNGIDRFLPSIGCIGSQEMPELFRFIQNTIEILAHMEKQA